MTDDPPRIGRSQVPWRTGGVCAPHDPPLRVWWHAACGARARRQPPSRPCSPLRATRGACNHHRQAPPPPMRRPGGGRRSGSQPGSFDNLTFRTPRPRAQTRRAAARDQRRTAERARAQRRRRSRLASVRPPRVAVAAAGRAGRCCSVGGGGPSAERERRSPERPRRRQVASAAAVGVVTCPSRTAQVTLSDCRGPCSRRRCP